MPYRCSKYDELNYRLLLDGQVVGWARKFGGMWEATDKRSRGTGKTVVEAFDAFTTAAEKLRKPTPNKVPNYKPAKRSKTTATQAELPLAAPPLPDLGVIEFNLVGRALCYAPQMMQ